MRVTKDPFNILQAGIDTALLHVDEAQRELEHVSPALLAGPITEETAESVSSHAEVDLAALQDAVEDLRPLATLLSKVAAARRRAD